MRDHSRSFSRISSSVIFVFLRVLSALRGAVEEGVGVGLLLSADGGEMGEVAASLVGGGGRGSITERVYICDRAKDTTERKREGEREH